MAGRLVPFTETLFYMDRIDHRRFLESGYELVRLKRQQSHRYLTLKTLENPTWTLLAVHSINNTDTLVFCLI